MSSVGKPYPFCWGIGGLGILLLFFLFFLVGVLFIIRILIFRRNYTSFFDNLC